MKRSRTDDDGTPSEPPTKMPRIERNGSSRFIRTLQDATVEGAIARRIREIPRSKPREVKPSIANNNWKPGAGDTVEILWTVLGEGPQWFKADIKYVIKDGKRTKYVTCYDTGDVRLETFNPVEWRPLPTDPVESTVDSAVESGIVDPIIMGTESGTVAHNEATANDFIIMDIEAAVEAIVSICETCESLGVNIEETFHEEKTCNNYKNNLILNKGQMMAEIEKLKEELSIITTKRKSHLDKWIIDGINKLPGSIRYGKSQFELIKQTKTDIIKKFKLEIYNINNTLKHLRDKTNPDIETHRLYLEAKDILDKKYKEVTDGLNDLEKKQKDIDIQLGKI